VDRRVEVGAGVLAAGEVVPVPGGPALVVARHFLDAKRPCLAHLRRQRDVRKFGRQGLGQVDDPDFPRADGARQFGEQAHDDSSFSRAFGLSRQRSSHSCATSPG
jgi:hypothetical protein